MPSEGLCGTFQSDNVPRMPRLPEVPGKPATNSLRVRVHDEMLEWIDGVRGEMSRSRFIRDLIRAERKRRSSR